jgi:hypothetical protein
MKKLKYIKLFERFNLNEELDMDMSPKTKSEKLVNHYLGTLLSRPIKKAESIAGKNQVTYKYKTEEKSVAYSKNTKIFLDEFSKDYRVAELEIRTPIEFAEKLEQVMSEFYGEKEIDLSDYTITMEGVEESTKDEFVFKYILLDISEK